MARKYQNGSPLAVGFDVQSNRPLDERQIVETKSDLAVAENCYAGIMIMVEDEQYKVYQWNGVNQSDLNNWTGLQGESGIDDAPSDGKLYGRRNAQWDEVTSTGGGDMTKAVYDTNDNGKVDSADDADNLGGLPPSGYMTKAAYDSNNNGKADDADNLGGFPPSHYLTDADTSGFMQKSTYDTNNNGIVDDSAKLGGENPGFYDQSAEVTSLQNQINTHVGDTDIHLSTDERAAINSTPNPPSSLNPFATQDDLAAGGNGDMLKAIYDQNDNGIVDNAENLGGQPPSTYDQSAHVSDTNNPHSVTKAQVGLGNVDNTADSDKPISDATQAALDQKAPLSHTTDLNNPHQVNKTQVGLGNVDNTSDADKPISDATQAALDQKADATDLDGKANLAGGNNFIGGVQSSDVGYSAGPTAPAYGFSHGGTGTTAIGHSSGSVSMEYESTAALDYNATEVRVFLDPSTGDGVGNRDYNDARYTQGAIPTDYVSNDVTGEPAGADPVIKMVSCTQAEYDAGPKNVTTFYVIVDTVFLVGGGFPGTATIGDAKYEGVVFDGQVDGWYRFRSLGQDEMERAYLDDTPLEAGSKYRITLRYQVAPGSTAIMKLGGYVNEELTSTDPITIRREFTSTETDMKEFSFYLTTVPAQAGQQLWIKELSLEKFI